MSPHRTEPLHHSTESWHPRGRLVRALDRRVHVVTEGEGPDVLFLHGFIQSSWAFRHNLGVFARAYRAHAACVPGFGWSEKRPGDYHLDTQARRVVALMDALHVARAHLVGNSLGGALSLRIALDFPDRVGRLVLVNPVAVDWRRIALIAALQHPLFAPAFRAPGVAFAIAEALKIAAYKNLPIDTRFMADFLAPLRGPGALDAALSVARTFNEDLGALKPRLGEISHDTLVVWGQRDQILSAASGRELVAALRHARLVTFSNCGHCPMEEDPERFNGVAMGFLGDG